MAGGTDGTSAIAPGTSGGWRGMNGAQRRIAVVAGAGFVTVVCLVLVTNALSTISDLRTSGVAIPARLVWSWEVTSIVGWLSLTPVIWWGVGRVRGARWGWPAIVALFLAGSVVASGWHITVMVALRHAYYAAIGEASYHFFGAIADRLAYEYRKDVVAYTQFVALAAAVRWLLDRAADDAAAATADPVAPRHLVIADGAVKRSVPLQEIESVAAAGNYVELNWNGRTLLHRATLAATEAELGDLFVRVHRGLVVRVAAIRDVEVDRSGDFTATLASGARVRGSRRYRDGLDRWQAGGGA